MTAKNPAVAQAIRTALGDHPVRGSLTRLAEAADVSVSSAQRWWALQSSPDPALWSAIEEHLGIEFEAARPSDELSQLRADVAELRRQLELLGRVVRDELQVEYDALGDEIESPTPPERDGGEVDPTVGGSGP